MGVSLLVFDILQINDTNVAAMLSLAISGARLFLFSDSVERVSTAQKNICRQLEYLARNAKNVV